MPDSSGDGVVSPAVRADIGEDGDLENLSGEKSSKFRSVAARANYLGVGRRDIHFAVKEACMGIRKVKRVARYIQAVPKVVITIGAETEGGSM